MDTDISRDIALIKDQLKALAARVAELEKEREEERQTWIDMFPERDSGDGRNQPRAPRTHQRPR